ncbi:hypothetical protein SEA_PLATTE_84 [Microbacterium phage Platte]|nr:hypothetical protein SEA_PLATTE_84 [Microbacterium phage Platte]
MSERKIERGEVIWSGTMIGLWLALSALGIWRGVEGIAEGEVPWVGVAIILMAAFWISRHVVKIIDYIKQ